MLAGSWVEHLLYRLVGNNSQHLVGEWLMDQKVQFSKECSLLQGYEISDVDI